MTTDSYSKMLRSQLVKEAEDRGVMPESGSGKDGYVLKDDLVAALEADDAKQEAPAEEPTAEERSEAADAEEESVDEEVEEQPVKAFSGELPEIGSIVSYRDLFSGQRVDARVAGHAEGGLLDLAVFSAGSATSRPGVERGPGRGQWSLKGEG